MTSSKYGWGKLRPSCLQCLNTPKWLLVCLSGFYLSYSLVINGVYSVSISTIEKRFGLTSSTMGLITSMYDIAALLVTVFVSYYGGRQSKSLWLSSGLLVLALGSFIFILPHIIIGPYQPGKDHSLFPTLCQTNATNASQDACDSTTPAAQLYPIIFSIGMLIIGFGCSPMYVLGVAYLDENVKKKVSPLYLGIYSSSAIIGAALGFGLAGVFLSINVDIATQTTLAPSDSQWIGNWWLGFVVLIVTSLLLFPWMSGYPQVLSSATGDDEERETVDTDDISNIAVQASMTSLKDMMTSTKTLFTIPSYFLLTIGVAFQYFDVACVLAFLPKIVQVVFNIPPNKVSLLYGVAAILPALFGQLLGSYLLKKLKLGADGALKFVCIVVGIGGVVSLGYLLTNCDNPEIIGVTKNFKNSTLQSINDCGIPCDCSYSSYYPVCDGNTTFMSPCQTRCNSYSKAEKTFHGCSCTTSNNLVVKPGKCLKDCGGKPALFLSIVAITGFLTFCSQTPSVIAVLRSVPYDLRAYAMGWLVTISRLLGSIPGPIVFGKLIDNVCILWQKTCQGTGSCQEYHHWHLILTTVVVLVTLKVITLACLFMAWKFLPKDLTKSNGVRNTCELTENNDIHETNRKPVSSSGVQNTVL